jgi:hypothetical protein
MDARQRREPGAGKTRELRGIGLAALAAYLNKAAKWTQDHPYLRPAAVPASGLAPFTD